VSGGDQRWFKRSAGKERRVARDIIIILIIILILLIIIIIIEV
jgi:hypothetical protein